MISVEEKTCEVLVGMYSQHKKKTSLRPLSDCGVFVVIIILQGIT